MASAKEVGSQKVGKVEEMRQVRQEIRARTTRTVNESESVGVSWEVLQATPLLVCDDPEHCYWSLAVRPQRRNSKRPTPDLWQPSVAVVSQNRTLSSEGGGKVVGWRSERRQRTARALKTFTLKCTFYFCQYFCL